MNRRLNYRNEDDKCYGATGMAIGLVVFDGEDMISAVSVDADPSEMIEFDNRFYFAGNPGLSAKTAWNEILRNFNLLSAMLISNVMCRSMVLDNAPVDDEVRGSLHDSISREASETCSLEQDEIDRLFDKNYSYLMRVFSHNGVQRVAHDFAETIRRERRLTRSDILEQLHALGML